jgi:uncharacterized HhH-GPD family protein
VIPSRSRTTSGPSGAPSAGLDPAQVAVAWELSAYARELAAVGAVQAGGSFTDLEPADELIRSSPEAFVLGVLFTQGIPAERAWAGPYLLGERLGHLDLRRLAAEPKAVDEALGRRPALHRFRHTLPRWISLAAARIIAEYAGDASRIWAPGSSVTEVSERLCLFDGIGRKKAAMAVELLGSAFGVELEGTECGTVAYDVQVRRVFLRSGLADEDTPAAIARAAALACPQAPGSLDLGTWLIGRETCRPRKPACDDCRLGAVCARRVWLNPEGVGVRPKRA